MNKKNIIKQIKRKRSFLCIGLDTDINKIPKYLLNFEDPIFEFNKKIIDATHHLCVAYKPNIAFYESLGVKGMISLEKTLNYIPKDIFTIADAKRGDISNTSKMYAKAFFENMNFDAITVAPYMGSDSVSPFLSYDNKWVILLALTSNNGSIDFQQIEDSYGEKLYEKVLKISNEWGTNDNMMYVVGATRVEDLSKIRSIIPNHFLLVPGVGAQGGSLDQVAKHTINDECGILVNSSRGILYSSQSEDFAEKAGEEAKKIQAKMDVILKEKGI